MDDSAMGTTKSEPELVLVLRSLLGDLEAFDELVRSYRGALIAVAQPVVGSRETAEDVAQDALLTAFKALPQLEDPARFGAWLYAIARHRARRIAKRDERTILPEPSELDRLILRHSGELSRDPEAERLRHEARCELHSAVGELPDEVRSVVVLFYFEEWSVSRIAGFLSVPITTVKWRLHQGRKSLRRTLSQGEGEANERRIRYRARGSAAAPDAPGDRKARARSQFDRQPSGRRAQLGPPV